VDYKDYKLRILDHARESHFSYWNALLTLNGILISVFSAAAIIRPDNKWMFISLVALPIVASFLIIKNFNQIKNIDLLK
jgi:hypothetical protein